MLDVHPPDHTPHTWRDFLLHIATITVGLLIAVGLEQTVEAIHHHNERRHLREELDRDSEKSMRDAATLQSAMLVSVKWSRARLRQVDDALEHDKPLPAVMETRSEIGDAATDPTWAAAKTTGRLALLPEEEMKAYSEADDITALLRGFLIDWISAYLKVGQLQAEFLPVGGKLGDAVPMSHANLLDLQTALRNESVVATTTYGTAVSLNRAQAALHRGVRTLDGVQQAERGDTPSK